MRDVDVCKVSANRLLKLRPWQHPRLVLGNGEVERGNKLDLHFLTRGAGIQRQRCQEGKAEA